MRSPRLQLLALLCPLLAACSDTPQVEAEVAAPETAGRFALVVLTQQFAEPGVAVSAQIMDYEGIGRDGALHALSAPEQAWLVGDPVDPGTCRLLRADAVSPDASARVDLLDVGALEVSPPAPLRDGLSVEPRELPPLMAALAGVVYDADAPEDLPYLAGGAYRVRAPGGEAAAIVGEIDAPAPVWLDGFAFDDGGLVVQAGDGPGPLVLLSRAEGSSTLGVACRALEGAPLRVPVEALAHLGPGPAELAVLRVTRASIGGDGHPGALVFITRDAAELTLPDLVEERAR